MLARNTYLARATFRGCIIAWAVTTAGRLSAEPTVARFDPKQAPSYQAAWAAHLGLETAMSNSVGMRLSLIPPGEFMMGSSAAEEKYFATKEQQIPFSPNDPRSTSEQHHQVTISRAFYIGVYEVTQKQFARITGHNPSSFSKSGENSDRVDGIDTEDFPVEQVSWNAAQAFCRHLSKKEGRSYRLPTEAEWEYSCRAGQTAPFSSGASISHRDANIEGMEVFAGRATGPAIGRPTSVGSYKANQFGLNDMDGNVAEWCSDFFDRKYYAVSPAIDPTGPQSGQKRVNRGGYWGPGAGRIAARCGNSPDTRFFGIGFRVVLELPRAK